MNRTLLSSLAVALVAGSLSAQQVALTEHFSSGVPPAGWGHVKNNPLTQGWIASADNRAWHEDESSSVGTCDDELISPVLDLSTYSTVYAHFASSINYATYLANHPSSTGDGETDLYVRVNGGAWVEAWTDARQSNTTDTFSVDLTALVAGQSSVEFAFRYYGTYAHETWVDWVQVSDSSSPPIFGSFFTLNLPSAFVPANGACDDFESYGGVVPSHMATTAVDAVTGLPDPDAWCSIAGGNFASNSGVRNLEMGMTPGATNYHNVRNALVIGYDGSASTSMPLEFYAIDHGEETAVIDGVWLSKDGAEWFQVFGPWTPLTAAWTQVNVDLAPWASKTTGQFYLAFVQEDNFPYAYLDGVGIDDVCVGDAPAGFTLTATGSCPGVVLFETSGGTPGGFCHFFWGRTGSTTQNNPNWACFGTTLDLSHPKGGYLWNDANGDCSIQISAKSTYCGVILCQAVDRSTCSVSNTAGF